MARKIVNRLIFLPQDVSIDRVVDHPHYMEIFISCPDTERLCPVCVSLTGTRSIRDIAIDNGLTAQQVLSVLNSDDFRKPASLPRTLCIDEFNGSSGSYDPDSHRWNINHSTATFPTEGSAVSSMSSRRSPWTSCSPTSWTIPSRNAGMSSSSAATCTTVSFSSSSRTPSVPAAI